MQCGDESADVAAGGTVLATRDRAMRGLAGGYKAPAREKVADWSEKCSDSATVALGAKTPVLDMADLFAAVSKRKISH